jgi:hypothetical protein
MYVVYIYMCVMYWDMCYIRSSLGIYLIRRKVICLLFTVIWIFKCQILCRLIDCTAEHLVETIIAPAHDALYK